LISHTTFGYLKSNNLYKFLIKINKIILYILSVI